MISASRSASLPASRSCSRTPSKSVRAADAEVVLVTPHWGPNMTSEPVRHVRRAADALVDAGATLVAGHSAHVPHGVAGPVLYDLGDFLDDYRVDPRLRNDLGLLFLVTLDGHGPIRLEALPLKLEFCHTRLASGEDAAWLETTLSRVGAVVGGRHTYESAGHWGDENPWGLPFFIVTHRPQEEPPGGAFTFVVDATSAL